MLRTGDAPIKGRIVQNKQVFEHKGIDKALIASKNVRLTTDPSVCIFTLHCGAFSSIKRRDVGEAKAVLRVLHASGRPVVDVALPTESMRVQIPDAINHLRIEVIATPKERNIAFASVEHLEICYTVSIQKERVEPTPTPKPDTIRDTTNPTRVSSSGFFRD
jgi:hypothetical protein